MEILRAFAEEFVNADHYINLSIEILNKESIWADAEHRHHLLGMVKNLGAICQSQELAVTRRLVDKIIIGLELGEKDPAVAKVFDNVLLQAHLAELRNRFPDELSTKLFLQVAASRREYFDEPLRGWEPIVKKFPDCLADIEEMNRCFSLSRYTASMFHALQVAEWGAIELGKFIGVTDPKKGWGPTTKELAKLVKDGHAKLPPNLSDKFSFLEQMNREIDSMVLAWRHKVDHAANRLAIVPNTILSPDIAEHIIKTIKVFMGRLEEELRP